MTPSRTVLTLVLFTATLLLAACDRDQPRADPWEDAAPTIGTSSSSSPTPTSSTPTPEYLVGEIPPCSSVAGSTVDPCEPDAEHYAITAGGAGHSPDFSDGPRSVRELLDSVRGYVSHMVLRGTYLPNTVRCVSDNPFRPPSYLSYEEYDFVEHALFINCYVDVRVGAYILGDGPSMLTIQRFFYAYWPGELAFYAEEKGQTEEEYIEDFRQLIESEDYIGGIGGREEVLFVGPAASISTEVWQVFEIWDVQRQEGGTVVAVHPDRDLWRRYRPDEYQTHRAALEMELSALTQAVTTANQERVTDYGGRIGAETNLPMLVTDANQLRQYYTAVGAYDPGAPTPAQPPPPCGLAVPDQGNNPGLMRDCMTLLATKDTLRGTGSLNWATGTAIASWDGVTTAGSPTRVTKVELDDEDLTGSIPAALGSLSALTHLDLSDNSLTGDIPAELGLLHNLEEVRLSGNSLTGCIPLALRDVATHDLSSLSLPYCRPPAPGTPAVGTVGEASVPLTWTAVANTRLSQPALVSEKTAKMSLQTAVVR